MRAHSIIALVLLAVCMVGCSSVQRRPAGKPPAALVHIGTYLGDEYRNFYGTGVPHSLTERARVSLGKGKTRVFGEMQEWKGAGWTGQPLVIAEHGTNYLIHGAYDHMLRKIRMDDLSVVWETELVDVIKATGTAYIDELHPGNIVIMQGSRRGYRDDGRVHTPFCAVASTNGGVLWKLPVDWTQSESCDNDSSGLYLTNGIVFNAAENGIGYFIDTHSLRVSNGITAPGILAAVKMYNAEDIARVGASLEPEASPTLVNGMIYLASGTGHVYGIDSTRYAIVWDHYIGADLNGTMPLSDDGRLFCSIEKQYIAGSGGVVKLDPSRPAAKAAEWFLPMPTKKVNTWKGGVVGSVAINDRYNENRYPRLFAVLGVEGTLVVGSQSITDGTAVGYDGKKRFPRPRVLARTNIGNTISTPVFTDGGRLVAASDDGVYLFDLGLARTVSNKNAAPGDDGNWYTLSLTLLDHFVGETNAFSATPVVWNGVVYIASDKALFALGGTDTER